MATKLNNTKKKPAPKKASPAKKKAVKQKAPPKPKKETKPEEERDLGGRPIIYKQETADKICEEISTSAKSLRTICAMEGMPSVGTVLKWLREDTNGFLAQYTRAKEEQADLIVEDILDIADDGTNDYMTIIKGDTTYNVEDKEVTSRSKLRVESRKWIASKLKPKKYGEKMDVTSTNTTVIVGYEPVEED